MDARQGGRPYPIGRRSLAMCVTLVAMVAAGGCDRLPASAIKQIREGHQAYRHRQFSQAQRLLSQVIAEHGQAPDTAEAYYVRGLTQIKSDHPTQAKADLAAGLRLADRPELTALIGAQLGNLDYEAGRYALAADHYARAADELPDRAPTDRVLLRYGISLQRSGKYRQAKRVLAGLLLRFDNGPAVAEAKRKVQWIGDYHAVQCGVYRGGSTARQAVRKLRDQGVDATAWRERRNGQTRYVVRAGQFQRYQQAQQELSRIRPIIPDAFIVP